MPVQRPEDQERERGIAQATGAVTGVDVAGNRFDTNEEAAQFFADLGLAVTQRVPFNSIVEDLVSPDRIDVTRDAVREENEPWYIWVLEPTTSSPRRK